MSGLGSLGYYGGQTGPHPPFVTMRCEKCGHASSVTATEFRGRGHRLRCKVKKGLFRTCGGHLALDQQQEQPPAG
jgi:hypothetical protein